MGYGQMIPMDLTIKRMCDKSKGAAIFAARRTVNQIETIPSNDDANLDLDFGSALNIKRLVLL